MSYSKSLSPLNLISSYLQALYLHPIRTKSITSGIIAILGNITAQKVAGFKSFDWNSLFAFGAFGFCCGGTIPHHFYTLLEHLIPGNTSTEVLKKTFIERLIYTPLFQYTFLFCLNKLEGKGTDEAISETKRLFLSILLANWKWLTTVQIINLTLVPPMLRVLVVNLIGFFWTIFLAIKKRQSSNRSK